MIAEARNPILPRVLSMSAILMLMWACTDNPTDVAGPPGTATIRLERVSGQAAGSRFDRARLVARDATTEAELATLVVDVDPEAEEVEFTLEITVSGGAVSVIVTVELFEAAVPEIIEWSAIAGPFSVIAGQETSVSIVTVGRGPLSNHDITSIQIQPASLVILRGETRQLEAVTMGGTAAPEVFWFSPDETVATLTNTGLIEGVGGGEIAIVAAAGTHADTILVLVRAVTTVQMVPDTVVLAIGVSGTVVATPVDQNGKAMPPTPVVWTTGDPAIATVVGTDTVGVVTGEGAGETVVTATADGVAGTATVLVLVELLQNGDFETGDLSGWTLTNAGSGDFFVMSGTTTPLNNFTVPPPPQGTFAAMTDQTGPGMHIIHQDVTVPTGGALFSATVFVNNQAGTFIVDAESGLRHDLGPNQHFRVDIMDPEAPVDGVGAGVLLNVFITQPGDPALIPYTNITADLTPFAGQTVRIRFAEVDNQLFFQAGVDAVSLSSTVAGPPRRDAPPPAVRVRRPPPTATDHRYRKQR